MFIIFGFRNKVYIIGPLAKRVCGNCHNESHWALRKLTKWFTLFFIPVFPIENKYFLSCTICDRGMFLQGAEANNAIKAAQLNLKLVKGLIPQHEYYAATGGLDPALTLNLSSYNKDEELKNFEKIKEAITPVENILIGFVLIILAIVFWVLGDGMANYNGWLVGLGWLLIIIAVYFFRKKTKTFGLEFGRKKTMGI